MLNNINNNSNIALNSRLIKQDSLNSILGSNMPKKNSVQTVNSDLLLDASDISNVAIRMYQRELDIRNFTQLATSDSENESHNALVEELFSKGVVDVFEDNVIESLANNKSLMDDLGL